MTYVPQLRDTLVAAARAQHVAKTQPSWLRRRLATPLGVVLAAVLAPVAIAAGVATTHPNTFNFLHAGHPAPTIDHTPPPRAGQPPSAVLTRAFSVLARPQNGADALPQGRTTDGPPYFADQVHRVVPRPPLRGPGQAVPDLTYVAGGANGSVCLVVLPPVSGAGGETGPTGECMDVALATAGKVFLTLERNGGAATDLFGVVPDGVETVRVSLADGSQSTLPVTNNLYSVATASAPRSVAYDRAGAPVSVFISG